MSRLPSITGSEVIRVFEKLGFTEDRARGSHHVLKREGHPYLLTVPVHGNRAIKPGTLRALIRLAGITVEEFTSLL